MFSPMWDWGRPRAKRPRSGKKFGRASRKTQKPAEAGEVVRYNAFELWRLAKAPVKLKRSCEKAFGSAELGGKAAGDQAGEEELQKMEGTVVFHQVPTTGAVNLHWAERQFVRQCT